MAFSKYSLIADLQTQNYNKNKITVKQIGLGCMFIGFVLLACLILTTPLDTPNQPQIASGVFASK